MENRKIGSHNVSYNLSEKELDTLIQNAVPKKSIFNQFVERTFNNLGTTVTGVSLHYDLLINGFVTKDYVMMGKGAISVLALCFCEDPKLKFNKESSPIL